MKQKLACLIMVLLILVSCTKQKTRGEQPLVPSQMPEQKITSNEDYFAKLTTSYWVSEFQSKGISFVFFENNTVKVFNDEQGEVQILKYDLDGPIIRVYFNNDEKVGESTVVEFTITKNGKSDIYKEAITSKDNKIVAWNIFERKTAGSYTLEGRNITLLDGVAYIKSNTHFYSKPSESEENRYQVVLYDETENIFMKNETMRWMESGRKQVELIGVWNDDSSWIAIYSPMNRETSEYLCVNDSRINSIYCWVRKEEIDF